MTGPGSDAPPFDFDAHRRAAIEQYQRQRPLYQAFASTVRQILGEALRTAAIKIASIEARAKTLESFGDKAAAAAEEDSNRPRYPDPLNQITDLAAARVITFFLSTLQDVNRIIGIEFNILERLDKSDLLVRDEKLGYQSLHFLIELKPNRTALPEYARYAGLRAEIQLRTVLQHAWAEIEHDIQYKSVETVPGPIRRRFMALAGLLEIADREFQAVQLEDERLRLAARVSVAEGRLDRVEITGDALKAYLDGKLGPDGRMTNESYEWTARMLRRFGFDNFRQIDESIAAYDHDRLSRSLHGNRQGQLTRFEDMLLAALGERFVDRHNLSNNDWWRDWIRRRLAKMKELGVPIGEYEPKALVGDGGQPA